jgi:hypothetical protein
LSATDPAPRLTSGMLVSALVRRVNAAGGFATILHKGDAQAGAIIVECADRGARTLLLERATGLDGRDGWRMVDVPLDNEAAYAERLERRRRGDPDLWIVELDIAEAERFAAETIGSA